MSTMKLTILVILYILEYFRLTINKIFLIIY